MHGFLDRRRFVRAATFLSAAAALGPELAHAEPAPFHPARRPRATPVRVRGRVTLQGRGLRGVRISDGLAVARTERDGRYELLSSADRAFVQCSVPAGCRIPVSAQGTAAFFQPLVPSRGGEMEASFALERLAEGDERHALLLLPDIQTQNAWEMERFHEQSVPDVRRVVEEIGGHCFGIACGDIMFDDLTLFSEYERGVRRMGIPFFQAVGNHDLDLDARVDEESTATFCARYGPRYYSFDRGAVRYVVLDDVFYHGSGYLGYLDDEQLTWLAADLQDLEPGSPLIVALHIPVEGTRHLREGEARPGLERSVANREALYRLLEPFAVHLLAGHTHENDHRHGNRLHEHVSGTVCGGWWSGPLCADGTPNGYSVYEVDGEQVTWRYKSTGWPFDHQMRVYLVGADPGAPDELVANVWDADERWTVVWFEGGERRGRMARRVGFDPASARIHSGPDLPPRRPWVDPYPRYLYYAPTAGAAGTLRVEATDPFGRTYVGLSGPIPGDLAAWL